MQRLACICLAAIVAGGCAYLPNRSLAYEPVEIDAPVRPYGTLAVRALREARPPRRYPNLVGNLLLTYLPLIPYIRIPFERLDESDELHKRIHGLLWTDQDAFTHLFAKTIADDLDRSGLFSEVRIYGQEPITAPVDYVLEGSLESSGFDVYASSYGLGIAGLVLWYLPIPMGRQAAHVEIRLRLRNARGEEVWSEQIVGDASRIHTMYRARAPLTAGHALQIARFGKNDEGIDASSLWGYYASAIRAGMAKAKLSLSARLRGEVPDAE